MSTLNLILIAVVLTGNMCGAANGNLEPEERLNLTAEDVRTNIQEDLSKGPDLSGQAIEADKNNHETKPKFIDGTSTQSDGKETERSNQNFHLQVCIEGDSVQRLDILETPENLASGCKQVSSDWQIDLSRMGISNFEKGWYRLRNNNQVPSNLSVITLEHNNIVQVTSHIMNELSEQITWLDLRNNKIERLGEGCFEHDRIFSLVLSSNLISEIEQNAFKMPELYQLMLDDNRLKNTRFVSTLPSSIVSLNLRRNEITEISANSFYNLKNLSYLSLESNKLTILPNQCLLGAITINQLSFSNNQITTVEPGAFEGLHPFQIFLNGNNISSIENGTFTAIRGLRQLNIERNQLTTIEPGMFDQPDLRLLQLARNNIVSFKKGAVENLHQLETLDISKNPIRRLEDGALSGLNKKANVLIG